MVMAVEDGVAVGQGRTAQGSPSVSQPPPPDEPDEPEDPDDPFAGWDPLPPTFQIILLVGGSMIESIERPNAIEPVAEPPTVITTWSRCWDG